MADIKVEALSVENYKPTKRGDPQKRIRTAKGDLLVSGTGIESVNTGDMLSITEPAQFGRNWYARLNSIEHRNGKSAAQVALAEKPSLNMILDAVQEILGALPESWKSGDSIQGSRACAQIINTIIMGIGDGRILLDEPEPDLPGDGTPPPSDKDLPPWERG